MKKLQIFNLLLIALLMMGCGSRKVAVENTKSSLQTSHAAELKTESDTQSSHTDKSTIKTAAVLQKKVVEDQEFSITADSATINPKTGNVSLKGNVKIKGTQKKQTDSDKTVGTEKENDLSDALHIKAKADSAAHSDLKSSSQSGSKTVDAQRGFNGWLLLAIIPVLIIGFIIYKKCK